MSNSDPTRRKGTRGTAADDVVNPPVARRRTQAERSEATRKLILEASVRVIEFFDSVVVDPNALSILKLAA